MLRLLFLDLELRRRMLNWEEFSLYSVGVYRTYYDMNLRDPRRPGLYQKSVDASLYHLGADYIDLYYQHGPDPNTPIEETAGTLTDLFKAGKIRYIGLSEAAPRHSWP